VVALAAWARPGWPRVLVALIAGAVPWLAYLGCLAYVELGVVFFAAVAAGLVAERCRGGPDPNWRAGLTAGLCVGFAAGCKYTAMALIIVPLGLARLAAWRPGLRMRLRQLALFAIGAGAAICPWLIRNWAFTGNPVYPFAYRWLDGAAWSPEQDAQWARGHRLPADQASLADRATILSDELFRSHLFGPAIWLVPAAAVVLRPTRRSLFAVLWIVLLIGAWTALTRMPGRFAVPVVVPLALLVSGARGGRSPSAACPRAAGRVDWRLAALVVAAWAGAVFGGVSLLGLLRAEEQHYQACGVNLPELVGTPEVMIQSNPINQAVRDPDAYVWLVGDAASFYVAPHRHYTVAFSRDPWLEFAAGPVTPADCVAWLRTRHVTHVVFSWPEIERLRRTYGFTPLVTPAWVQELERAGLRRVAPAAGNESLAIYEVPTQ
jgi:hypothetical protein